MTIKTKLFESPKNRTFPKGLTNASGQKMPNFSLFGFGENKTRRETRKVFLTIKKKVLKVPKIAFFSKGLTPAFGLKMPFFSLFVFV